MLTIKPDSRALVLAALAAMYAHLDEIMTGSDVPGWSAQPDIVDNAVVEVIQTIHGIDPGHKHFGLIVDAYRASAQSVVVQFVAALHKAAAEQLLKVHAPTPPN